jgi:hypothetical protein
MVSERPQVDPFARSVTRDGHVYDYTSATASFVDGQWQFGTKPLEWEEVATLPEEDVRELEELIERERILDLPGEFLPPGTSIGRADVTWTVRADGRVHTIRLLGVDVSQVPQLAALDRALQIAIARAVGT